MSSALTTGAILGVVASAIWVWVDASRRGMRSGAWAAGTPLLWLVFFPVYLIKRAPRTVAAARPAAASALNPEPPVAHAGGASTRRTVAIVALLYFSGLDRELYKVGLNYYQCGQNGFGAVFCGDDLTAYNDHLQAVQQQATQAEDQAQQDLCAADPTAASCP